MKLQNFTSQANCNCPHKHHQHQQQQARQQPTLIKSHTCAYQLQDLAGYNRALMPPLDNTDFSSAWRHVNNNSTTPCAFHQSQQQWAKAKSSPQQRHQYHHHTCPRQKKTSTPTSTPTSTMCRQQKQRRSRSTSSASKQRRNSSYHSYDDLDASSAVANAERKVVASLKYLCACTGATLRNLSKKTKDLHAKNYTYTKVNGLNAAQNEKCVISGRSFAILNDFLFTFYLLFGAAVALADVAAAPFYYCASLFLKLLAINVY